MKRALQLRIHCPGERLPDLFKVAKMVARAQTFAMQLQRAADADKPTMILDTHPKKTGKDGREWPDWKAIFGKAPELATYKPVRAMFPELESTIANCVTQDIRRKYFDKRIEILRGRCRTPEWRDEVPIPIRDGRGKLARNGKGYTLAFQLYAKTEKAKPVTVTVFSDRLRDWQLGILDRYASGQAKLPRVSVHVKRARNRTKWFVDIPYDIEQVEHGEVIADRIMYVRRAKEGLSFLQCVLPRDKGAPWTQDLEYESALRAKENIEHRRRSIANKYRCDAAKSARRGHGRDRVMVKSRQLTDRRDNQQRDFNYNRAAYIVERALRWKCARIEMENLSSVPKPETLVLGKWSYYQFNERVKMLCELHGIELQLVKPVELLTDEE
jgi:hypothetical protein